MKWLGFENPLPIGNWKRAHRQAREVDQLAALADLRNMFQEVHNGHAHEAIDILEPKGTPVHAVVSGNVDSSSSANPAVTRYMSSTKWECIATTTLTWMRTRRGCVRECGGARGYHRFCGIDGQCGCAHAAFAFRDFRIGPERLWWRGKAIDPYLGLVAAVKRAK